MIANQFTGLQNPAYRLTLSVLALCMATSCQHWLVGLASMMIFSKIVKK